MYILKRIIEVGRNRFLNHHPSVTLFEHLGNSSFMYKMPLPSYQNKEAALICLAYIRSVLMSQGGPVCSALKLMALREKHSSYCVDE